MVQRVTIRKFPRNPDFYEVRGGGIKGVIVRSKVRAMEIAQARRRLIAKKRKR